MRAAAEALRSGEPTVILIGGDATREPGLAAAVPARRRHRRAGAVRDVPRPGWNAARACPRWNGWPTSRRPRRRNWPGAKHLILAGREVAGVVLRLPR